MPANWDDPFNRKTDRQTFLHFQFPLNSLKNIGRIGGFGTNVIVTYSTINMLTFSAHLPARHCALCRNGYINKGEKLTVSLSEIKSVLVTIAS